MLSGSRAAGHGRGWRSVVRSGKNFHAGGNGCLAFVSLIMLLERSIFFRGLIPVRCRSFLVQRLQPARNEWHRLGPQMWRSCLDRDFWRRSGRRRELPSHFWSQRNVYEKPAFDHCVPIHRKLSSPPLEMGS